jgi:hypothetical protein
LLAPWNHPGMTVTTSPWPTSTRSTVLTTGPESSSPLEPSGLTVWSDGSTDWLYLVSDNGKIARSQIGSSSWSIHDYGDSKANDFESIATVTGELMVGVEGARSDVPNPQIKRFDPTDDSDSPIGSFTGSVWNLTGLDLDDNSGMEGLTFVPVGSYPSAWTSATPYYGGVMLAAFQSYPGTIYAFNLPKGNGDTHNVQAIAQFTTQLADKKISELAFANGKLYVLYDDSTDWLEELVLNADQTAFVTTFVTQPPYVGNEAMTVLGSDLYLGLDQSGKSPAQSGGPTGQYATNGLADDYVFKYAGYANHR